VLIRFPTNTTHFRCQTALALRDRPGFFCGVLARPRYQPKRATGIAGAPLELQEVEREIGCGDERLPVALSYRSFASSDAPDACLLAAPLRR